MPNMNICKYGNFIIFRLLWLPPFPSCFFVSALIALLLVCFWFHHFLGDGRRFNLAFTKIIALSGEGRGLRYWRTYADFSPTVLGHQVPRFATKNIV